MSDLRVNSSSIPINHEYIPIAPTLKNSGNTQNKDLLTPRESQHESLVKFWDLTLSLIIKISFIKNFIIFVWARGLSTLQPLEPIKNSESLLFNSGIEVPSWFDEAMQIQCILYWKEHFIHELEMVQEKDEIDLNHLALLSQIQIPEVAYQNDEVMEELQAELETSISILIQKIQTAHPNEPLQLHLGGHSDESPLERKPLSTLFLRAFGCCLESDEMRFPLRILHVHGPLNNPEGIQVLLEGLKNCSTLYHLHLDLDLQSTEKAFTILDQTLLYCDKLSFLVFRKDPKKSNLILTEQWDRLASAIRSHHQLKSLSFYGLPTPPESFKKALEPLQITTPLAPSEGFCIKIP